jgi:hypothetical protein
LGEVIFYGLTLPLWNDNMITSGERSPHSSKQMTSSPLSYGPFISRNQAQEQGLKQFFTGKPCKHGHVVAKQVAGWLCSECNRLKAQRDRDTRSGILKAQEQKRRSCPAYKARKQKINRESYARLVSTEEGRERHRESTRRANDKFKKSEKCVSWRKQYRAATPLWRVQHNLRTRLRELVQNRSVHFSKLTGCAGKELVAHLEAQFLPGMTWDNYGLHGWHIDHIRPCASFDLTDPEQQRECFHYTNLQPLWAEDNIRKSDTWEPELVAA